MADNATIADKLKALNVQPASEQNLTEGGESSTFAPVPSTSLAQTLAQALHSSDNRLLDSCFVHGKEHIIKNSVKSLPSSLVLPLVDALVARLGRSKKAYAGPLEGGATSGRGKKLLDWIRNTLIVHAAYLVTIPALQQQLSSLQRLVQTRLQLHQPLLELQGRLDLAVSQIELRRDAAAAAEAKKNALQQREAQITIEGEESSSEESDADVQMNGRGGGHGSGSEDEGSIEDVMLNGHISDEESDGQGGGDVTAGGLSGFLDLEAEESDPEDSEADAADQASEDEDDDDADDDSESESDDASEA